MILNKFGWTFDIKTARKLANAPAIYMITTIETPDDPLSINLEDVKLTVPIAFTKKSDATKFVKEIVKHNAAAFTPDLRNKSINVAPVTSKQFQIHPYVATISKN